MKTIRRTVWIGRDFEFVMSRKEPTIDPMSGDWDFDDPGECFTAENFRGLFGSCAGLRNMTKRKYILTLTPAEE